MAPNLVQENESVPVIEVSNRRRWSVILLLFSASVLNYLDRATISFALPLISKDLHLGPSTKGLLLAVKGDFHAAEAEIRIALAAHPLKDPVYHHAAYDIACIYDIGRNSHRAFGRVAEADGGLRLHGAQRGLRALNAVAREE